MLKLSVCYERGYPSIYIGLKGGASAILGEDRAAPPRHGSMPPPVEGVAERRR